MSKTCTAVARRKRPDNNVTDPIQATADAYRESGLTPGEFAGRRKLNPGTAYWMKRCLDDGGLRWSDALAGEGWRSTTVAFPADASAPVPAYIISPYAPRRCDVTDRWFIPITTQQRFAPGLSEAIKRAARRDLARARDRYISEGDWGNAS